MTTETSGIPKIILHYEWILENVEEEPKTIASKMILFRGEKVFRVGLKNREKSPVVLFFMAIDLNKIGMKVEEVVYGIQDSGNSPATMWEMKQENIGGTGDLQLFTNDLAAKVTGNRTFLFRICIEGILFGYSFCLSDRLAKDQLWAAATSKNPDLVDVEFVVKDKKFSAHKSILAARSPMFADKFTSEQQAGDGPFQIRIDDVDPSTVEQFLHFIYTGESWGTLANEELLKLADKYQLTTLSSLCKTALTKIKPIQMVTLVKNLNKDAEIPNSSKISPEKEMEIFFDGTTATFRCNWTIRDNQKIKTVMQYQNEDMFFAYFTGKIEYRSSYNFYFVIQPIFHCLCAKHRSFGLKVEDVYFTRDEKREWSKMETKNVQKSAELLHFISQPESTDYMMPFSMYFYIKIISTIGNYYYEMMDDAWMTDFWSAATNQRFTDVEIFFGTVKLMEAHRVILSARSPVLNASLVSNTGKAILTFDAKFDVEIVRDFFKFLYTGFLETSANNKQLLELATIYEVETLKSLCQLANRASPDVEELADALFEL